MSIRQILVCIYNGLGVQDILNLIFLKQFNILTKEGGFCLDCNISREISLIGR